MRRRIIWAIVAVTSFAVALFGIPLAVVIRHLYVADARTRLEREATLAARAFPTDFVVNRDPVELPGVAGISFGLYTPTGKKISGNGPDVGGVTITDAANNRIHDRQEGNQMIAAVPVAVNESVVAVIRAQTSISGAEHRAHVAWLFMGGLAASVIALAGTLAILEAKRITRPLVRVRDSATRLGQGDFTVDVPPAGIPELDELGASLTTTARRLGRAMEREQAFSTHASHQLRTPIAGLRVVLETELITPRPDPTLALHECLAVTDHLAAIVNDLLRLARESAQDERLDVDALLAHCRRAWHGALAAAGRPLRVHLARDLPAVATNNAAIRQSLDVLLDNSLRHGAGLVSVTADRVTGGVALRVRDEGAGVAVPAEDLFDQRGSSSAGHGIGLGLARLLIESEGGRLQLANAGPHPCFEIILPAAPERASQSPAESALPSSRDG